MYADADEIAHAIDSVHLPPWQIAFAYGSGVLPQASKREDVMLDVIIVVDDPVSWHRENLARNAWHYSILGQLGAPTVSFVQQLGPGVYFNTHVPLPGGCIWRTMKYGVVSIARLADELVTWRWLYLAGRLHKPVVFLKGDQQLLGEALQINLRSAVISALSLLPTHFDSVALFSTIAALSYDGDVRFDVGAEDPNKIANIVKPNLDRFAILFKQSLQTAVASSLLVQTGAHTYQQTHATTLQMLPVGLVFEPGLRRRDNLPHDHLATAVRGALRHAVRRSSFLQTTKGMFMAGPARSWIYLAAKLSKGRRR